MNNFNKMFSESFDDLTFIKNQKNNNLIKKYIFVFDFDLTLTSISSDGMTRSDTNYMKLFESEENLEKLKYYLNRIIMSGNITYINTRALENDIKHILKNVNIEFGKNKLIEDIKGSKNILDINKPFDYKELLSYGLDEIKDVNILWGVKKVIFLNQIKQLEDSEYTNIFFFDDSPININTAKINGYYNSFLIGSNDSGIYGLDYTLIKLEQILDLLGI